MKIKTIVFDFGGVLIDWNPRHLYRKVFDDEEEMEWFLENVCTMEWNASMDKGKPFAEAVEELQNKYPEHKEYIEHYHFRWPEMLKCKIEGSVEIMRELIEKEYSVYGLTNWSAETFPVAYERFSFLSELDGMTVSGKEKLIKPDEEIFHLLIDRFKLKIHESVFIDDSKPNIETARRLGFQAIHFISPEQLKEDLERLKVL